LVSAGPYSRGRAEPLRRDPGRRPGTAEGEALRFFAQFKSWPLAAVSKGWGREIYGGQGVAGAVSGLAQMVAVGTLIYLFLHSLQELLNPGYLRRQEQRIKQQNGQTFWLRPSQDHLRTFGR
jgi:hypothetical protein